MKITIAILAIFVAVLCNVQTSAAVCDVQAIYNRTLEFCNNNYFFNIFLCSSVSFGISNANFVKLLQQQEKIFCAIPFFGEICELCNFALLISDNSNSTISAGNNSTAGAQRSLIFQN
ncbi:uncharacterized protein LOC108104953 [Drosophila eugracilis]|uniref:uncharacterized protein LOC108104953 n=1 Tax=Drosophila eugracilis TaxID=29029 RepID=UPI0007E6CEE4|nr:uncharacterized protein LOC108104953 [Drosophila eugracilis]